MRPGTCVGTLYSTVVCEADVSIGPLGGRKCRRVRRMCPRRALRRDVTCFVANPANTGCPTASSGTSVKCPPSQWCRSQVSYCQLFIHSIPSERWVIGPTASERRIIRQPVRDGVEGCEPGQVRLVSYQLRSKVGAINDNCLHVGRPSPHPRRKTGDFVSTTILGCDL